MSDSIPKRFLLRLLPLLVLLFFASSAFAADYQCRETNGCTAQISENGQLKTVNFRKGDIVCTEDGWILSTEDGWKKLKKKRSTPTSMGQSIGAGFYTAAQARGPFDLVRGAGVARRWDGTLVQVSGIVASGYYTPVSGAWRPVGPATSRH